MHYYKYVHTLRLDILVSYIGNQLDCKLLERKKEKTMRSPSWNISA